jgi:LSD1 subclass zinc finger protein
MSPITEINCKKCGGPLDVALGANQVECPYCQTTNLIAGGQVEALEAAPGSASAEDLQKIADLDARRETLIRQRAKLMTDADAEMRQFVKNAHANEQRIGRTSGDGNHSLGCSIAMICGFMALASLAAFSDDDLKYFCFGFMMILAVASYFVVRAMTAKSDRGRIKRKEALKDQIEASKEQLKRQQEQKLAAIDSQVETIETELEQLRSTK